MRPERVRRIPVTGARPNRRQRQRRQHRAEIIAASRKLFAERGFERTTMADIAAAADFSVGALYNFFEHKQDLYRCIIQGIAEEIHVAVSAALASTGTPIERIERFVAAQAAVLSKHAAVGRIYFELGMGSPLAPTAGLATELRVMYERTLGALQATFREGIENGCFAPLDPLVLALTLEALITSFVPVLAERPDAYTGEQMSDAVCRIFFEGVRV